ncbi:MAG TPA: hypothetical protein VG935_04650 [Patescibacteria group bacterium]|nr:hypothetical protein [Patescibacteria group bacterium]
MERFLRRWRKPDKQIAPPNNETPRLPTFEEALDELTKRNWDGPVIIAYDEDPIPRNRSSSQEMYQTE